MKKKVTIYIDEELDFAFNMMLYSLHQEHKQKLTKSGVIESLIKNLIENISEAKNESKVE